MFQIKRVGGLAKANGNSGNETIEDANTMAQMELFKPLSGPLGIARLEPEDGIPS
jgi:hypothetical protein